MSNLNVGICCVNTVKNLDIVKTIKSEFKNDLSFKYLIYGYKGLSLDCSVNLYRNIEKLGAIKKDSTLKVILRLDNPIIFYKQISTDSYLKDVLNILNETNSYVVYTNDLVKDYIASNYPNIVLIVSEYRYNLGTLEDFVEDNRDCLVEINMQLYERLIPLLEYNYIAADKIWLTFNCCNLANCPIRNTCIKTKSFGKNHRYPCIDILGTEWKYHIGYKQCYRGTVFTRSITAVKDAILRASKRNVSNFMIMDRIINHTDLVNLFADDINITEVDSDGC